MAKTVKIRVYDPNTARSEFFSLPLPDHVTFTGDENHFALAYHDANMIVSGMREILERQRENKARDEQLEFSKLPARQKITIEGITF